MFMLKSTHKKAIEALKKTKQEEINKGWVAWANEQNKHALCKLELEKANRSRTSLDWLKIHNELKDCKKELAELKTDSERYRILRTGRYWSVVDGAGDVLRGELLDRKIDAKLEQNTGCKNG